MSCFPSFYFNTSLKITSRCRCDTKIHFVFRFASRALDISLCRANVPKSERKSEILVLPNILDNGHSTCARTYVICGIWKERMDRLFHLSFTLHKHFHPFCSSYISEAYPSLTTPATQPTNSHVIWTWPSLVRWHKEAFPSSLSNVDHGAGVQGYGLFSISTEWQRWLCVL